MPLITPTQCHRFRAETLDPFLRCARACPVPTPVPPTLFFCCLLLRTLVGHVDIGRPAPVPPPPHSPPPTPQPRPVITVCLSCVLWVWQDLVTLPMTVVVALSGWTCVDLSTNPKYIAHVVLFACFVAARIAHDVLASRGVRGGAVAALALSTVCGAGVAVVTLVGVACSP